MKKKCLIILIVICLISCDETLEFSLIGKKVTLLAPVNNLNTTDSVHTFYWEKLNGAVQYQLQIVSPRFDSIVRLVDDTIITNNTFHTELDKGTYQWRVKALNNSTQSDNSDIWNLKIH